jgi:hypothetical protein
MITIDIATNLAIDIRSKRLSLLSTLPQLLFTIYLTFEHKFPSALKKMVFSDRDRQQKSSNQCTMELSANSNLQ